MNLLEFFSQIKGIKCQNVDYLDNNIYIYVYILMTLLYFILHPMHVDDARKGIRSLKNSEAIQ